MAPHLNTDANGVLPSDADHLITSAFSIKGRDLSVNGHPFLLDVPPNITTTPTSTICKGKAVADTTGCFIGFQPGETGSHHVAPLGRLPGSTRFTSIFRFKIWWTTHWTGTGADGIEHETQLLLLDRSPTNPYYVLFLPLLEGPFRASLQPTGDENNDSISVCVESGSSAVAASLFRCAVYLHAGEDPYALVRDAVQVVEAHLGTFKMLEEKRPPGIVDKFGWCTWDAFYLAVDPDGVLDGVKELESGGCPPGMVLIDDGWQSICHDGDEDPDDGMNRTSAGEQMPCRLVAFEENRKFREYRSRRDGVATGMGAFVKDLKGSFPTVEHVYVWHALCGYWGGLRPGVAVMPDARVVKPTLSPGAKTTMEDLAVDKIVGNGVGLVTPPERAGELYDGMHSHLRSVGIDGVKVDVIHVLEMLGEDYGGRVELAKNYYRGLTASIKKHFDGNGVIASMEHCNEFMFLGTEAISLGRVGDDFWCTDPSGDPNGTYWLQGCHMVHCAYNSLWMGNFIHPDWDMFQSTHPCAAFHAASRAISGGPVYISDSVGSHDFSLLRRLALPDGTILRCEHYALPTRDCLFEDPLHDGKTMLKVWNLNKFTGVLGAFNCQGGGWSRKDRRNKCAAECSQPVTAKLQPSDVEWKNGRAPIQTIGVQLYAVYLLQAGKLVLLRSKESIELTLKPFDYELFTVSPVKVSERVQFAPIGLTNMLNTGGSIQSIDYKTRTEGFEVEIGVKGAGEMKAYSSAMPVACMVNGDTAMFVYDDNVVTVEIPWSGSSSKFGFIKYLY